MRYPLIAILTILIAGCSSVKAPYFSNKELLDNQLVLPTDKQPVHTLFLIGDTGSPGTKGGLVLKALESQLREAGKKSSLVFLGDQAYPKGLPFPRDKKRGLAEQILERQLKILENYNGKTYVIPGERDWNNAQPGGLKAVKGQELYWENFYPRKEKKVYLYPGKGCGDPEVEKVSKDLVFVFLDSQWWLQDWSKESEINEGCEIKSRYDLLKRMEEIFAEHKNDEVVVCMHHPLRSVGIHGGHFGVKEHLLPFAEQYKIPVPLPLIGSLVPVFRNITGFDQDLAYIHYQQLVEGIEAAAVKWGVKVLFASAHDNGLQHFDEGNLQFVVSGSGSRTNHTGKGGGAAFTQEALGFCKISFYKEFEAWLEIYRVDESTGALQVVYTVQLRPPRPGTEEIPNEYPPVKKTDTILAANPDFAAGSFKKVFLGEQYRDIWATPVRAPMIDLEEALGGLQPIKKGGGMASNSLRIEKSNGKQYILRSVNKDYRKLVPPEFTNLKVINVLQDQNSASHPYGALIVPPLSKAAGIYYTNPKLVYLSHQRGLGNYNSQFPEGLYLLEERPDDDWSDAPQFGNSEEIISYADLLEILREKKSHFVDQEWVCKSRMFDLLIHDWDRHDDQWRWASFEKGDQTIYRPIPRDRDQVFYKFEGIIPSYIAAFMVKKFKTMKDDVKDVKSLSFNARHFDRYFMNELEWEDWKKAIEELQQDITDEVIREAVTAVPKEVQGLEDEELIRKLISRRDHLLDIGRRLYEFLAKEVDIVGTDDDNEFEIEGHPDGSTTVRMYVEDDDKKLLKYKRTFFPSETKEIRLYGLREEDQFEIKGADVNAIKLRIIGGEDEDEVENSTKSRRALVYDYPSSVDMKGPALIDKTSKKLDVNEYNRYGFRYNTGLPLFVAGYTIDDGIWLGGAINWTRHKWRKDPYRSKQKLSFSLAPGSRETLQFAYEGHFPDRLGRVDLAPSFEINSPRYENFFGLGNETENLQPSNLRYHWVRLQSLYVRPMLQLTSRDARTHLQFGPVFEAHDIRNTEGRVSEDQLLGFTPEEFNGRYFLGGALQFYTGFTDNLVMPANGFILNTRINYLNSLEEIDEEVLSLDASTQFYFQLSAQPQLIFANNIGFQKVWGQPQFYQYPDLGNLTNLRGFRNNRFRGDVTFFHNLDLRLRLFNWNNSILPMDIGILGGFDYGRVWLDGEDSDQWHHSQTIGIWMNILGVAVLNPYYSITSEKDFFSFRLGFSF